MKEQVYLFVNNNISFELNSSSLDYVQDINKNILYENYFLPIFSTILDLIHTQIKFHASLFGSLADFSLIFAFVIVIINLFLAWRKSKEFKFTLSFLQFFPRQIIFQAPNVAKIFAGNFRYDNLDPSKRSHEHYEEIIELLPEGIIISSPNGDIISQNKASMRILQCVTPFHKIDEFLHYPKFNGNAADVQITKTLTLGDEEAFIEISKNIIHGKTVFTLIDITQGVKLQSLIDEELSKNNELLQNIIPHSLVERYIGGETNISFSVQSSTILFLDIVSFTPWCLSNAISVVISTLNTIFQSLDEELLKGSSLMRMKYIGDSYMAAGGLFQEPNQPLVHAKEMVQFGLDAIAAIVRINEENGTNLEVRVGINTGGPIVAGIINLGKPNFKVLSPAIAMAQQLEQSGIPMRVQISRSAYEMIFGAGFKIKERGEITIKTGKVITHIVFP
jgi:class 3 adenylate cyclase